MCYLSLSSAEVLKWLGFQDKIFCKVFAQKIEDLTFEDVKCLKMLKIPEDL